MKVMLFRKRVSHSGISHITGLRILALLGLLTGGVVLLGSPVYAATPAEQGQTVFDQKCKACHSIGGGRLVGPDLKGITASRDREWLVRFITVPDKLIAQGDPIAKQIVQQYDLPMPNLGVTDADAAAILSYIDAQSSGSTPNPTPTPTAVAPPAATSPAAPLLPVSAATGKDLFTGALAFKNNGPACVSCHDIRNIGLLGGGTVGKDLTDAYSTLGEAGIGMMLKTTPFPMMKEIYTAKPLTDTEIASVLAFLKDAGNAPATSSQNPALFLVIGAGGALIIIGMFHFLWRGRLAGVRRQLVKGDLK